MRSLAPPIGTSVTCLAGSLVFTGLCGSSPARPLSSIVHAGTCLAFTFSSIGVASLVKG